MGFVSKYRNKYQTGGLQHLFATQIREEVGAGVFESYFRFAFVRNPWDKAVSQYMLTRRREDLRDYIGMRENDSFKRYLELIAAREHVQWAPQHRFVFDDQGRRLVNFLGRYEQLAQDAAQVFSQIGVSGALGRAHATERLPMSAYYDREAIDAIATLYAQDIELFGYSSAAPVLS